MVARDVKSSIIKYFYRNLIHEARETKGVLSDNKYAITQFDRMFPSRCVNLFLQMKTPPRRWANTKIEITYLR